MTTPLSPTERTTIIRGRERALQERQTLEAFLAQALVAHLGVTIGDEDPYPVVLPTAYAVDRDGPDAGGTLYLHGSVAARWLRQSLGRTVCVTVTEVDGLVAARSGFHHSMNYRSAVIIGAAREVTEVGEREHALDLIVDHMIPGRSGTLRPHTRKELAATLVLALPMSEASMKQRDGDPIDDQEDIDDGVWAGTVPLQRVSGAPVSSADSHHQVPQDVLRRARDLARSDGGGVD